MNPRRYLSLARLLILPVALAILTLTGSLLLVTYLDWQRTLAEYESDLYAAGRYSQAAIQARLNSVLLLAQQWASQPQHEYADRSSSGLTFAILSEGHVITTTTGRYLPRLQTGGGRLPKTPASTVELDDQGALVAAAVVPAGEHLALVLSPFTVADVQAIKEATGYEVSLYAGQTQSATTLRDAQGQSSAGQFLAPGVLEALPPTGLVSTLPDPAAHGGEQVQLLVPLYGLDSVPVGAIAVSCPAPSFWDLTARLWPALATLVAGTLLLIGVWLAATRRLRQPLAVLERDLAQLASRPHASSLSGHYDLAELDTIVQHINQLCAARAALAHSNERLNDRLIQTQALAMLGRLAAGVAHDLNNPLATIRGLADIMLTSDLEPEVRNEVETIRRQAERSGHIVSSLLSYARRQRGEPERVSFNELIEQTLELFSYQARVSHARCESQLDPDLPPTWGDPSQLQQVLFNLINNALQAMSASHGGGTLRVESAWSAPGPGAPQGWITIRVRDDGPGIADDVLPRLFQPYFTTKGASGGTGLGLSIASDIIRRHNGRIWAENNPRGGACFTIQLPVTTEPPPPAPPEPEPPPVPVASEGPRRVLLADGDAQRLHLLSQALRKHGYQLCTVGDGEKARGRIEKESFDLVVCGLDMPLVDGRQLYTWARAKRPDMARRLVFIVSGEISAELEAFLQVARAWVLLPPFQEEAVRAVISQALQTAGQD